MSALQNPGMDRLIGRFVHPLLLLAVGLSATASFAATYTSSSGFVNTALSSSQSGTFTAQFDASVSISPSNATVGLCKGAATAYTGIAAVARFNSTGTIDARNGGAYAAASSIPFTANTTYHFRLVVNVPAHTYSIYVTPSGSSEKTVGLNYAFRSEQSSVTSLDTWNADVNVSPGGSLTVNNFMISGTSGNCTVVPSVPSGLASPSKTSTSVNLSWNSVSTPAGCSVTYNVYRGTTLAASVSSTNAVISGLTASTAYSFSVAASDAAGASAKSSTLSVTTSASGSTYTAAQVLAGVKANMTSAKKVNTLPHINTMTHSDVNVYQVTSGIYAYSAGMAIDTDGSDPDPDPDHQSQTTWSDNSGKALGSHTVPFFVLGDDCWDRKSPCPHFYYAERNIKGLQFALFFYNGKCIGGVFGDTQTANSQTTSDNDSRELGEASVKAASLLGIPSSGTTGGVDNGVTYVIFSGSAWVISGSSSSALNTNAQAVVQKALNQLGSSLGL